MGYPVELFQAQAAIAPDLICNICHDVFKRPLHAGCSNDHLFCTLCLIGHVCGGNDHGKKEWEDLVGNKTYNCPVCRERVRVTDGRLGTFVRRQVERMPIWCEARAEECPWGGSITDYDAHASVCMFSTVECGKRSSNPSFTCTWTGKRRDLKVHRGVGVVKGDSNSCPLIKIECTNRDCDVVLRRYLMEDHWRACEFWECENEEGGECSFRGTFAAAMAHGDLCWDRAVTLDYISCALGFDLPEDWRTDDGLERILEGIRLYGLALREQGVAPMKPVDGPPASTPPPRSPSLVDPPIAPLASTSTTPAVPHVPASVAFVASRTQAVAGPSNPITSPRRSSRKVVSHPIVPNAHSIFDCPPNCGVAIAPLKAPPRRPTSPLPQSSPEPIIVDRAAQAPFRLTGATSSLPRAVPVVPVANPAVPLAIPVVAASPQRSSQSSNRSSSPLSSLKSPTKSPELKPKISPATAQFPFRLTSSAPTSQPSISASQKRSVKVKEEGGEAAWEKGGGKRPRFDGGFPAEWDNERARGVGSDEEE